MRRVGSWRLMVAAVALLLVACGGATTATLTPAAPADPGPTTVAPTAVLPTDAAPTELPGAAPVIPGNQCSLATNEEISTAAGVTVAQAVEGGGGGGCAWNDASGGLIVNALYVGGDIALTIWEGMENPVTGGVPVSGLGDEALWLPNTTQFAVRNGDFLLSIGVALTLGDDAARRGIGEAVARLILTRV